MLFVINTPDQNAMNGVTEWIKAFKNNLRFLLADFDSENPGADPVFKVQLVSKNVETADTDLLESSFQTQPSLQVLSTVGRYAGQSTFVDNDIYLGDLRGRLKAPYVHFSREIAPGLYSINREALAVVTLYAYGMALAKALPADSSRYVICKVLDRANMYRDRDLGADMKMYFDELFKAISYELEARACGGKK
ncbi:hypothetical protein [Bradyrhizobium sp. 6(2017)]|uniref:hypothetical protein n=1 Tax=Bradyrhizobium sp. 6(2017) TaxID=1197460 RepID=UPI000406CBB8|nr:hypothetical protein [Bradyrhizobium sp. 6(2017)]QIG91131.1 hypothetical protein G6P99_00455 [Bradyrhizobium sp. 6(2017)]